MHDTGAEDYHTWIFDTSGFMTPGPLTPLFFGHRWIFLPCVFDTCFLIHTRRFLTPGFWHRGFFLSPVDFYHLILDTCFFYPDIWHQYIWDSLTLGQTVKCLGVKNPLISNIPVPSQDLGMKCPDWTSRMSNVLESSSIFPPLSYCYGISNVIICAVRRPWRGSKSFCSFN